MQHPQLLIQPESRLGMEQELFSTLTPCQQEHFNHWKDRLSPKKAWMSMLSKQYRDGILPIDKELAKQNDKAWSSFVNCYMAWEVEDYARECSYEPDYERRQRLVKIGGGTGLGVDYLGEAAKLFDLEVYDWLASALKYTERAMTRVIVEHGLNEEKVFLIGEASQVCRSLDVSVGILEIIRVDEHMSDTYAALTLQGAGQILVDPRNRVVLGGARKGELNERVQTETCHHRDENFLLENLRIGAGKDVYIYRKKTHEDVEKVFTFHTLRGVV